MKRATLATTLALGLAGLGLAGCAGQPLTFTIAEGEVPSEAPSEPTSCYGISDSDVQDVTGADLGAFYLTPVNINLSQFDQNACTWSDDSHLVSVLAEHKPVFPEQVLGCNMPPLRGEESLEGVGDPGWWTWSETDDFRSGTVTACEGEARVRVIVHEQTGDEAELKQQAEQFTKLALDYLASRAE